MMDEAAQRRRVIADGLYLEARSHALMNHSRELIAEAQRMRARHARLISYAVALRYPQSRGLRATRRTERK